MGTIKTSINLRESVAAAVDGRAEGGVASRSGVISRDLERYYEALQRARATLREKLTHEDLSVIFDDLKEAHFITKYIATLHAHVADHLSLRGVYDHNGALIKILQGLSFIESCALVDAAERYWYRVALGEKPKIKDALEG